MKKQSAALRDDGETKKTGGPMKRPAATGSLNKTLEDMRGGIKKAKTDDDDENQKNAENENESEESDHRDKGKAIKFRQMQKDLPPHILDLYEREAMSKSSPRARTNIINQLFTKLPTGTYSLNVDKPMFKEAKEMFQRRYGSEKEKGYPRTVMKGLYFQNSDQAFEHALEEGEIYKIERNGKVYAFQSVEAGTVRLEKNS